MSQLKTALNTFKMITELSGIQEFKIVQFTLPPVKRLVLAKVMQSFLLSYNVANMTKQLTRMNNSMSFESDSRDEFFLAEITLKRLDASMPPHVSLEFLLCAE